MLNNEISVKKKLKELNSNYLDYKINIDKRLSTKNINGTKHHIIAKGFEIIPNMVIFWTIQYFLTKKGIKTLKEIKGFNIKEKTIYVNKTGLISLSYKDHTDLHIFLEFQKKALFMLYGINEKYLKYNFELEDNNYSLFYNDKKINRGNRKINNSIIEKNNIENSQNFSNNKKKNNKLKDIILKANKVYEKVLNEIGNLNLLKHKDFLKILSLSKFNYANNLINNTTSLIRNTYIKENAKIKQIVYGNKFLNEDQNTELASLSGNSELISSNILKLEKYKKDINKIFNKGLIKSLDKILIIIDKDYNIKVGLPLIAYLLNKEQTKLSFKLIQLNDGQIKELENKIGFILE